MIYNYEPIRWQHGLNSDSCDKIYIPQLRDDHKPKSGQRFESLDDAHEFYNNYAKEAGFIVRINSSRKNKETNEILRKEYVCSKEEVPVKGVGEKKRRRGITREGCKAKLVVVKLKSGTYVVNLFVEGHNRPLTSLKRQIYLHINNNERNLRNGLKGHDADMLYGHFQLEHKKNLSFTFKIEADEEDRITPYFWADTKSRKAYTFFGDVVLFDSTYNTNRYCMIFAPFVGVNNHGQTTVFACSFLSDETTNSFLWLFKQFKKAMPGGSPKMIITYQDPAMTKAIVQVFPNITHKYCSWHILDKFSKRLGGVKYRDYFEDFRKCIWESKSTEEFDSKWMKIVEKSES
ncbi:protein FAR1-RELATED SEQUENCE 5-like [Prunus avium]|uniref:Protein FAR1-RELATED SEQUENCE 5-like n=1 Tax=Prunus avium TaxID=42229 RepID=A0A6P5T8X0_PRUAV|nr:protein FAR1-RELATED SEQUENCE 5-like [Prunus avium]